MLDTTSDNIDTIMQELKDATVGVRTIMVSKSVRDAAMSDFEVKCGDYISISDKNILSCEKSKTAAACEAIKVAHNDEDSIVLLIKGSDASSDEADAVCEFVRRELAQTEGYKIDGEQDIYDFIIIME